MGLKFEWHPGKAAQNNRKHKVAFDEASTVFADSLSSTVYDPDHSNEEDRYITIGYSEQGRLLMISHTERGERIRIISARELTPLERQEYEEQS